MCYNRMPQEGRERAAAVPSGAPIAFHAENQAFQEKMDTRDWKYDTIYGRIKLYKLLNKMKIIAVYAVSFPQVYPPGR